MVMLRLKGFPTKQEIERARIERKPLVLAPSVRALCNYRCLPCYVPSGKQLEGEIGLAEHKSAIEQISRLGARYIVIAMVGEPFLDSAFYVPASRDFPLVDYANQHGLYTTVFTNSSLVTKENLEVLRVKNISLIGKLWSLTPSVDDELTGVKKEWVTHHGVLIPRGLALMMDAGFNEIREGETRLGADVIVTAKNLRDIPEVVKYLITNGIKPIIDTMIPTERAQRNYAALRLTPDQKSWLYAQLVRILGEGFAEDEFVQGCATKQVGLAYDNFGNVKVCCALGANIGNIETSPLESLYERIQVYRAQLPTYAKEPSTLNSCDTARLVIEQNHLE